MARHYKNIEKSVQECRHCQEEQPNPHVATVQHGNGRHDPSVRNLKPQDQDSPAEDTSSPGITKISIVEQSSVTYSTGEGLSELIVTGNSVQSNQNSRIIKTCP